MIRRLISSARWMKPGWTGLLLMALLLVSCGKPGSAAVVIPDLQAAPLAIRAYPYPASPTWTAPSPADTPPQPQATRDIDPLPSPSEPAGYSYQAQPGDTLAALARRFRVARGAIHSPEALPEAALLSPGQILYMPGEVQTGGPQVAVIPDSEVVFAPSAWGVGVAETLQEAGGFLAGHGEYLRSTGWNSAAQVVSRVALEFSINPRLLLSLLEYECGCVRGPLRDDVDPDYLLGVAGYRNKGLYHQLEWAANQLSEGYYGWRSGTLIEFQTADGIMARPSPGLNAGSVALAYYFARKTGDLPGNTRRLIALHTELFGDPRVRDTALGPLLPGGLSQPAMGLPFEPGVLWSYSSGPHAAWGVQSALAALDFAPAVPISGCVQTDAWVVAVANGLVVRSELGVVVQDLYLSQSEIPIDGLEQTGWAVVYLHIEERERVAKGTYLRAGERIGHPSCEGGRANGTHIHIARKYNGEWIAADGPLPFVLDGWTAHAGDAPYRGTLTLGKTTLVAHPNGSHETQIMKPNDEP